MNRKIALCAFASAALLILSGVGYAAGDAAAGKDKASACTSCHGVDGQGSEPNTKIAGMSVGNFKKAMMQMFAKKLSDQDVEDLAAYYTAK